MIEEVKRLMKATPSYKTLLQAILENPYIEKQGLVERVGLSPDELEALLQVLAEKMIVLELASQADSSLESRVPKKIYLVNPDLESDLREIL